MPAWNKEDISYSTGYEAGKQISSAAKAEGLDFDFDQMVKGMQDGLFGKMPRMSQEEMQKAQQDPE